MNYTLLPQDPLLNLKFPRPIVERTYCGGSFIMMDTLPSTGFPPKFERHCNFDDDDKGPKPFKDPFSTYDSKVRRKYLRTPNINWFSGYDN